MNEVHWADLFPQIEAYPTSDPRIFQTRYEKIGEGIHSAKRKRMFCCVIGADCYGIDVVIEWASPLKKEATGGLARMKQVADHYEQFREWPIN